MKSQKAFTLIELLVVIGIIVILGVIAISALDPAHRLSEAHNQARTTSINNILKAIDQNMSANNGAWTCPGHALPNTITLIGATSTDIAACLVPAYLTAMPFDPSTGFWTSTSSYATGFRVTQNSVGGSITVDAPAAELGASTTVTR